MISSLFFRGTAEQARGSIQKIFQTQGYCVINFLYFAQAMKFDLYIPKQQTKIQKEYSQALKKSDIILLDGIAMQIFDRYGGVVHQEKRKRTDNLNGTDFLPFLLHHNKDKKIAIILSTVYDPKINKGPERMQIGLDNLQKEFPHIDILFSYQSLYQERGKDFPFNQLQDKIKKSEKYDYIFFLNGIGAPTQEIRSQKYLDFFKKNKLIVLNNGATIDYYSKFEQRAPEWIVKLRIGETIRRIINKPEKNLNKFLDMFKIIKYRLYLIKKNFKKQELSGKK